MVVVVRVVPSVFVFSSWYATSATFVFKMDTHTHTHTHRVPLEIVIVADYDVTERRRCKNVTRPPGAIELLLVHVPVMSPTNDGDARFDHPYLFKVEAGRKVCSV